MSRNERGRHAYDKNSSTNGEPARSASYAYSQFDESGDYSDYDYGHGFGDRRGLRPDAAGTPWYRQPLALVGFGAVGAVVLGLGSYAVLMPNAGEDPNVVRSRTPSSAAPTPPSTVGPQATTTEVPAPATQAPLPAPPPAAPSPPTSDTPTDTPDPATTSSTPGTSRPSVVIIVPPDRRPHR